MSRSPRPNRSHSPRVNVALSPQEPLATPPRTPGVASGDPALETNDQAQTKLFDYQWRIINEQMQQISTMVDGLAALRQEVNNLRGEHDENLQSLHTSLNTKLRGYAGVEHVVSTQQRLDELEQFVGDVSVNVRHGLRVTIQQRLAFIEKDIGDSAERHERYSNALAEAKQNLVDFHTAHGALEQRVTTVENMIGDYAQKQNDLKLVIGRFHDAHDTSRDEMEAADKRLRDCHECVQGVHGRLQHEVDNWEKHCGTFKQRIDVLERLMGNSADQHDQQTKDVVEVRNSAVELGEKMREIHGALQGDLKARDAHHANIQQRVDFLEKCVGDSADSQSKYLKDHKKCRDDLSALVDAHEKHRAALEIHRTTLEERMNRIENVVEDMVDRTTQKHQLAQLATCLVDVHGHVNRQTDRQRSSEERLTTLESRIFDSSRTQTRNLEVASSVAKEQAILSARVMGVARNLLGDSGSSTAAVPAGRPLSMSNGVLRDLVGNEDTSGGGASDVQTFGLSFRGLESPAKLPRSPLSPLSQLAATVRASSSSPRNLDPSGWDGNVGKPRATGRNLLAAAHSRSSEPQARYREQEEDFKTNELRYAGLAGQFRKQRDLTESLHDRSQVLTDQRSPPTSPASQVWRNPFEDNALL